MRLTKMLRACSPVTASRGLRGAIRWLRIRGHRLRERPLGRGQRKENMSKKTILRALAVISAAFFALPSLAVAEEIHIEPAEHFNVSGTGGEVRAENEPTVTCTKTEGNGTFDAGGTTTGSIFRDYTGCHTTVFGFTASCKSEGAEIAGTVANGGTFHMITWKNGSGVAFPAVLMTTNTTKMVCAGISVVTFTGATISTITSPACGGSSKNLQLSLTATESTQNHLMYTGKNYDLFLQTGSGENKTAAITGSATNTQASAGKLNCT
jgi:hypothetical protein